MVPPFWIVWTDGGPSLRYDSEEAAIDAAEVAATQNSGVDYYVAAPKTHVVCALSGGILLGPA